jgi:hypothetical protein
LDIRNRGRVSTGRRLRRGPAAALRRALFLCVAALIVAAASSARASPARRGPVDWNVPHGSRSYRPVRALAEPTIDGRLDEAVWALAPRDDSFASVRSKPYGMASTEPTIVQVAYDDSSLYVAFRCAYSTQQPRDDSWPADEETLFKESERVGVLVDTRLDHASARSFTVGRRGARGDLEITYNGAVINREWRGLWDAATSTSADAWTAELRIPWGTLGLPAQLGAFQVGVNFVRSEPRAAEYAFWALVPPNSSGPPSFYGHLVGMSNVHPSQRLYLQPFVAAAVRRPADARAPRLRDFTGQQGNVALYGGFYARYRPAGPVQLDATMNPDFSTATPDEAVANLDRFELNYPELRPFFAEDKPRFEFGVPDGAQLFYTRRLGLRAREDGSYEEVPILYGAKGILREGGTEVATMSVGMAPASQRVTVADNAAVVRLNHSFGDGNRLGNIALFREGGDRRYLATGIDGQYTLFDQHLVLSGFLAQSTTKGAGSGPIGNATVAWASQDFGASASVSSVSAGFDPQLGFVARTGVRTTKFSAAYTPLVADDLVRQVLIETALTRATHQDDSPLYTRASLGFSMEALNRAAVSVWVLPSVEYVDRAFTIAADRLLIEPGRYDVLAGEIALDTPPRRTLQGHLGYTEGDLFAGYQRSVNGRLALNLGHLYSALLYELTSLHHGTSTLWGHRVSARSTVTYSPAARTTLIIEANTLTLRSVAQLVSSYTFGELSTLSLALSHATGQAAPNAGAEARWYDHPSFSAVTSFAYGFSPF